MDSVKNLKLLVSGTGRCGTRSLGRWLTEAGIPCGHEEVFTVRGIAGAKGLLAESSWLAAPHLSMASCPILHLVRHPLQVLCSLEGIRFLSGGITENNGLWAEYAQRWTPGLKKGFRASVEKHMRFIIDWNSMVQEKASARIQLEEASPSSLVELLQSIAPGLVTAKEKGALEIPFPRLNSRPTKSITLADLPRGALKDEFLAQAQTYGYRL
jgi:hypothetical protein